MNSKNSNNTLKDETIYNLNQKVDSMNREREKVENEKQEMNEKIKHWMARAQAFEQDKNFLQNQIIESKRQNKLLKLAIGRIQGELEQRDQTIEEMNKPVPITMANIDQQIEMSEAAAGNSTTFLTEAKPSMQQ